MTQSATLNSSRNVCFVCVFSMMLEMCYCLRTISSGSGLDFDLELMHGKDSRLCQNQESELRLMHLGYRRKGA